MSTTYGARTLVISIVDVYNTKGLVCLSATDGDRRTTYMVQPGDSLIGTAVEIVKTWASMREPLPWPKESE